MLCAQGSKDLVQGLVLGMLESEDHNPETIANRSCKERSCVGSVES